MGKLKPRAPLNLTARQRAAVLARMEQHFTPEPNTSCWLWFGSHTKRGYGTTSLGRRRYVYAHRLMFELFVGPPGDEFVLHRCDTPECVNPDHLFLGTLFDNMQDAARKGRTRSMLTAERTAGECNVKAKLTADQVREIRQSSESNIPLAERYGVTNSLIGQIRRRQIWRHV